MIHSEKEYFNKLFEDGALEQLEIELARFIEQGDLDARYLAASFSVDQSESNAKFDERRINELHALSIHWHIPSLIDLAYAYKNGDDVEANKNKYMALMQAAALLGDSHAKQVVADEIELELNLSGLREKLDII